MHAKCVGLSQSDAVQTPLESSPAMSIARPGQPSARVEAFWIDVVFLGRPNQWPGTDDDSELQCVVDSNNPWPSYSTSTPSGSPHRRRHCCPDWDAGRRPGREHGKPFALRYIVTHLIAETARHDGHLDILRELVDGVTGE